MREAGFLSSFLVGKKRIGYVKYKDKLAKYISCGILSVEQNCSMKGLPIMETPKPRKTWEQFRKRTSNKDIWACIDAEGNWFDTGFNLETAIHWCRMADDEFGPHSMSDMEWMDTYGRHKGYSVVCESLLEVLYDNGLVH